MNENLCISIDRQTKSDKNKKKAFSPSHSPFLPWIIISNLCVSGRGVLPAERWRRGTKIWLVLLLSPSAGDRHIMGSVRRGTCASCGANINLFTSSYAWRNIGELISLRLIFFSFFFLILTSTGRIGKYLAWHENDILRHKSFLKSCNNWLSNWSLSTDVFHVNEHRTDGLA